MNQPLQCRSCGFTPGEPILDLGIQPLANNLPLPSDLQREEPKVPLGVFVCPNCWLLQLADLVPPVTMFSEYLYFSSFSDALLAHARNAAERYVKAFALGSGSRVIEIASNDGYLLQNMVRMGIPCFGIEPAANIAAAAKAKGIETVVEFFGKDLATRLSSQGKNADLILGNNVFAHAPQINDFVGGLAILLNPKGRIILEFPYGVDLIKKTEFDTIYHEHVFYFTLTALEPAFLRHRLEVIDVEKLAIHGGSLRLFVGRVGEHSRGPNVQALLADEARQGIDSMRFYEDFSKDVRQIKSDLLALLGELKAAGKRVAAYGASAKGSTLLNYAGIGKDQIEFVADRSIYKQGRLTPGTHIPIVSADELLARRPDYTLLLTWNFAQEILAQQSEYRATGGKFIIPIPKVEVV